MDERRTGNQNYEIKEVTDHQKEIARRLALGDPPDVIAASLDITTQTVSNFRNNPIGREMIEAYHSQRDVQATDIAQQIAAVAPDAIALLSKVVKFDANDPDITGLAGIPDVADQVRVSLGIVKTIMPKINLHKHIVTSQLIKDIKKRAFEGEPTEYEEIKDENS